jgi:hypothetical protein
VVLLASALRQGQNPSITLERLKGLCGVWRTTVKRWQRYFKEFFTRSVNYRRLSGHLMPPIGADQLPKSLLARFYQTFCDPVIALVKCLQILALGP